MPPWEEREDHVHVLLFLCRFDPCHLLVHGRLYRVYPTGTPDDVRGISHTRRCMLSRVASGASPRFAPWRITSFRLAPGCGVVRFRERISARVPRLAYGYFNPTKERYAALAAG